MKQRLGILSILCVIIGIILLLLPACGSSDIDISSIKGIIKLAPENTIIFSHIDLKQVRQNRDLAYIHEQWQQQLPDSLRRMSPGLNLDFDDIHYCGELETVSDVVGVVAGNFNTQDIRDGLAVNEYSRDNYREIEIWVGTGDTVAIYKNIIIIGTNDNVMNVIDVMTADSVSIYDCNKDIQGIADNIPHGFLTMITSTTPDDIGGPLRVTALSFNGKNTKKIEVRVFHKFRDKETAEATMEDNPDLSHPGFPGGEEYVETVREMDIEDGGMLW